MTRPSSKALNVALALCAALFCIPFAILLLGSLSSSRTLGSDWFPLEGLTTAAYVDAWGTGSGGMGSALLNSLVICSFSVVIIVLTGALCGYGIARVPSRASRVMYFGLLLGIIIPSQMGIIPLYAAFDQLGLLGTHLGMILLWSGLCLPVAVFLYSGFIRAHPIDYEEAAMIDGASFGRMFFNVVLPLLRPITGTVVVMVVLLIWNDFFFSLIFLGGSRQQTLPVALYSLVGEYSTQWNVVFAAVAIALAPMMILFLFVQKQMIRGFAGGIRG